MVATRGRTFKRPWRRSCLSSKLKSSSAPIGRKDSWCFHAVGSSNAPLLGSTAAEGLPRIGRTSIATRWRSCGLPQSASCSENFVIPPDVFGQTLSSWRYEFASPPAPAAPGVSVRQKLSAILDTLPVGELLLRGDGVAFPPGGCAYRHTHQGPGIRCLIEGGVRIDTAGRSTSYGPGGAWYERGPEPVFAQAAEQPSRFIRVMILPRALIGKSSLQFVDAADAAKPRAQQYKIFADFPIARPKG